MVGINSGGILIIECGRQLLSWLPMIPYSWHSCPWMWAGFSDLYLMGRMWQKWCYHFSDYITKDCGFSVISTFSCAGTFFCSALACSNEKGCKILFGGVYVARFWRRKNSWGKEVWSESCQQPLVSELGSRAFPVRSGNKYRLGKDPKPEDLAQPHLDSWPRETVRW